MMHRILLAFALSGFGAPAPTPAPAPVVCPDKLVTTGAYRNFSYGFTVTLPASLHGHWNSAECFYDAALRDCVCLSDHGRDIPLGPEGRIVIFAEYASDGLSLPTRLYRDLESFRAGADVRALAVTSLESYSLGGLTGYRYTASLEKAATVRLREAVFAESADASISFEVVLDAPASVFKANHEAFVAVLNSWRVTPRE